MAARPTLISDTIKFVTADSNTTVTATGTAYITTPFMGILGTRQLPVIDGTTASFSKATIPSGASAGSNYELAVMLDVTGSMCDDGVGPCTTGTKIDGLKQAAKDLINIVVSADQTVHTSRVALVPFSTRIRVGPDGGGGALMKTLTNLDATKTFWYNNCIQSSGSGGSENAGNWVCYKYQATKAPNWKVMPCVSERFYNAGWSFDLTDDAPGPGKWLNAHDGTRNLVGADSSNAGPDSGSGNSASDPSGNWNYSPDGACADTLSGNDIQPLTSTKKTLTDRIDALQSFGSTSGALATSWTWYMLSPQWASIWTGGSQPGPYSDLTQIQANGSPKLRKVAILMTDGGFDSYRSWKDQDQQVVSNYATDVCSAMKKKGIEIYTVGFAIDKLPVTQQPIALATLKACGTDLSHFYQTYTVSDLQTAFQSIGVSLGGLRLTQ